MEYIYLIIMFVLGSVLGSFYNVVGLRLSSDGSILEPKHSYCPNCHTKLKTWDLVPIFSYLFLRGKCRYCGSKISMLYPLMEFLSGILFAVSFYAFGFSLDLITSLSLVSLFVIIIVSDVTNYIIIDEVLIFFGLIILINNFVMHGAQYGLLKIGHGLFMFTVMLTLMLLGNFIFKKETLGGGDIKLMFITGLVLSPILGLLSIFLASVIALPVSIVIYLLSKNHMIPFGPFLMFSLLILYFMNIDVNNLIRLFTLI